MLLREVVTSAPIYAEVLAQVCHLFNKASKSFSVSFCKAKIFFGKRGSCLSSSALKLNKEE